MRLSIFENAWDREPKHRDCTWQTFSTELGPHRYVPVRSYSEADLKVAKEACPCFSPAEYPDGATRANENVARLWMFVADLDHLTEDEAVATRRDLQSANQAAIVYSSFRHALGGFRMRVVLPLSRPVDVEDWPEFWHEMNAAFQGRCDDNCKDPSRIYFAPFAPVGMEPYHFYWVLLGNAVNVDGVLGAARTKHYPERALAIKKLGEAWPEEGRHEAHLALAGGLLLSGVTDSEAVDVLCAVAEIQEPGNEDRHKREQTVAHTREWITRGERVVSWTTLAKHVGDDVAFFAKSVLEAPPKITRDQLRRFAQSLARRKDDRTQELAEALKQVVNGDEYAELATRNEVTTRLSSALADRFPSGDAQSIADLFVPSLQLIGINTSMCPSLEDIASAIKRRQDEIRGKARDKRVAEMDEVSSRLREAWDNERSTPYTSEEIASFGPEIGKRWIVRYDRAFYLFCNGIYRGPYTEAAVTNAMAIDLAPASSAGVKLYTINKDGERSFKQLKMLVDQYGTVARELELNLLAQGTMYDEQRHAIIEAPCPKRPINPVFHTDIDQWLRLLAGDRYDALEHWISVLEDLERACVLLFLTGRKGTGKSMFAEGISRRWSRQGPASLESAMMRFNDALLGSPIVFGDERIPTDNAGRPRHSELRAFIQALERPLERKFLPIAKLIGAIRIIVAAHDPGILATAENLGMHDIEGTAERILHIPTRPEAEAYLASLRPTTHERGWVELDKIAEHCQWIRQNRRRQPEGRFIVGIPNDELYRMLVVGSGIRSAVCLWLVEYLLNPSLFRASAHSCVRPDSELHWVEVRDEQLLVNVHGPLRQWELYCHNDRAPNVGVLSRAITTLSESEAKRSLHCKTGERVDYRVICLDNLRAWCELTGFVHRERVDELIAERSAESAGDGTVER